VNDGRTADGDRQRINRGWQEPRVEHRMNRRLQSAFFTLATFLLASFAQADDSGWQPLFNSDNLDGWEHVGPGRFVIEDGKLKTEGGLGLLWYTREKISNAKLRIVYHAPESQKAGNAGVFIRIPEEPTEPWMPVNRGYEIQIDDTDDDYHRTGVVYSFTKAKSKPAVREWNTMEITLDGDRTIVHVNGELVTDYREGEGQPAKKDAGEPDRGPRPTAGYIGLQNHGDGDVVYFREVSLQKLKP
jgi:hypothetical protein